MKPKGRYNIKLSGKKGVKIRKGTAEDIPNFYKLLKDTATRDNFNLNTEEYYKLMLKIIPNAMLLIAEFDNTIIAGGIFTYTNKQALYYYGASSNTMRNLMAPYLIQWQAILVGKEKQCKYFDFMGIANPNAKADRLKGVTEFKLKFGGETVKFNPAFKIIQNRLLYNFYRLAKKIKKIL